MSGSDPASIQQLLDADDIPLTPANDAVFDIGVFADPVGLTGFLAFGSGELSEHALFPGTAGIGTVSDVTGDLPDIGESPGPFIGKTLFIRVYKTTDPLNFIAWNTGHQFEWEIAAIGGPGAQFSLNEVTLVRGRVVVGGTAGFEGPLESSNGNDAFGLGGGVLPTDTDLDGIPDSAETGTGIYVSPEDTGSDPNVADTDGDGLQDGHEIILHGTDPNKADTDGDGFEDKFELDTGFDPKSDTNSPDTTSSIRTAVELHFFTGVGFTYRIEASDNLFEWTIVEDNIVGTGGPDQRFYSTEDRPGQYIRVVKSTP